MNNNYYITYYYGQFVKNKEENLHCLQLMFLTLR